MNLKTFEGHNSILGGVEDENVEIISCDAAEAIKKFKSGELESSSDLKGEQITEAVEDGITKIHVFSNKVGRVFPMIVASKLPEAE